MVGSARRYDRPVVLKLINDILVGIPKGAVHAVEGLAAWIKLSL
jgi:hypothetical protein